MCRRLSETSFYIESPSAATSLSDTHLCAAQETEEQEEMPEQSTALERGISWTMSMLDRGEKTTPGEKQVCSRQRILTASSST